LDKMPDSQSYQGWIRDPIVRACGDIIMDAFHHIVGLGCSLKMDPSAF